MKQKLDKWLKRQPNWQLCCLSVLLTLVIGVIDFAVRVDLSISIFYLVPVALAAWYINRSAGMLIAVLCSLVWLWADVAPKHHDLLFIPIWNSGIRLGFSMVVSYLISLQQQAYQRELHLAQRDGLTGIHNRRAFIEILQLEMERSRRYGSPFTLAYLDIDYFKGVNDQLGHAEGDRLLKAVARRLQSTVRTSDTIGRLGGDEFAILLPHIGSTQAYQSLTRIHAQLKLTVSSRWPIGFSIGAATFLKSPNSVDEAITRADEIMYKIKRTGKNGLEVCVVGSDLQAKLTADVSKAAF